MPLALVTIGIVFVVVAYNGTFTDLFAQLEQDLTGQFLYWLFAVIIVGMIGYIPGWEKPSRMFLALIILGLILANGGVFQKVTQALQSGPQPDANGQTLASINTAPQVGGAPNPGTLGNIIGTAANNAANLPSTALTGQIPMVPTNPTTGLGIGGV